MKDSLTNIGQYFPTPSDVIIKAVAIERDYSDIYYSTLLEILPVIIVLFALCIERIKAIKLEEEL